MVRLIKKTDKNYTNISNVLARDSRLSWKARGIFIYMWSQADSWQFYVKELVSHATDGEASLTNGLKELENFGYLKRVHHQSKKGIFSGMDWILTDQPDNHQPENTINGKIKDNFHKNSENPSDGKTTGWETHRMENRSLRNNNSKNYQQQELSSNKKTNSASPSNALSVSKLKDDFEKVWNKYPNKKGKKEAFNHYKTWRKSSKKHTNEYLLSRLDKYKKYCDANSSWYHPQYGSTWFNGSFDDDYQTDNSSSTHESNFVMHDDGESVLDDVPKDDLPF